MVCIFSTILERSEGNFSNYDNNISKFEPGIKIAFCLSNYEKVKNQEYLIKLAYKYNFYLYYYYK